MKILLISFTVISICNKCISQSDSINQFNAQRLKIVQHSMIMLGAWGAGNLLYSGIASGNATGSDTYFHKMNMAWGAINFTLGVVGFLSAKSNEKTMDFTRSLKTQLRLENIYLFNSGLDVAYCIAGLYYKERAKNSIVHSDRNRGYGESLIMQGAALFLFDGVMYLVHHKHGKKLLEKLNKAPCCP